MDSLIYSLNATVPVFLVIVIGYILKRIGMLNDEFVKCANKFNFTVTLPAMLFTDLMNTDILGEFEPKYVGFCAIVTVIAFAVLWAGARVFVRDKSIIGEFVQASYRSSAAVLGAAFIKNIYGDSGMAPIMIIGCVPLFNIFAVTVLTFENGDSANRAEHIKKSLINIAKNPIILSIAAGVIASLIRLNLPEMADKTLGFLSDMASPLALIAIGAGFEAKKAAGCVKSASAASFIKLVVLPAVFLPIAVKLGFRAQELVALVIMLGSPTTPSSYIMAKNMGSEGALTTNAVVLTTFFSSLTMTFWIFIMRYFGFII